MHYFRNVVPSVICFYVSIYYVLNIFFKGTYRNGMVYMIEPVRQNDI